VLPVVPALLALVGLTLAAPDTAVRAEALIHKALAEYDAGQFEAALQDATAAYEASPRPALLYDLGQIHRALDHWARAEFFYKRYLAEAPEAPNRGLVQRLITDVEAKQQAEARAREPAPPATVIVEAAAPAAPAPAAAVSAPPSPPSHKHTLSIALGVTGLVMLGAMAASIAEVVSYNGSAQSGSPAHPVQFDAGGYERAQFFQVAEWVAGGLGVGFLGAAAFTW